MSVLCACCPVRDMGAALSQPQEGEAGDSAAPPTMADVIRERKKKAGGASLGTLRRRIVAAARRPRDQRPDRGCEHARFIRSVVSSWRLAQVFVLCRELECGAALRDLTMQAELAREPAPALHIALLHVYNARLWCDVEIVNMEEGWSLPAHRAILNARSCYFRSMLWGANRNRCVLTGPAASVPRAQFAGALRAIYGATSCPLCTDKWELTSNPDTDLDIINTENNSSHSCSHSAHVSTSSLRRLAALLGFSIEPGSLQRDCRNLLYSDGGNIDLSWRTDYEHFRSPSTDVFCHGIILAARSRFFRNILSRRKSTPQPNCSPIFIDEQILPRRYCAALLHAAYTDQVDLSLVGRPPSSPLSTNNTSNSILGGHGTGWASVARGGASNTRSTIAMLDDAFKLYEIARFVEMRICVQGCEDAIVSSLSSDTVGHILQWSQASHASSWVHRQAMRYLLDEFVSVMSGNGASSVPRSALSAALASPQLQCSETAALRALLRWASASREPWLAGGLRTRRREVSAQALRELAGDLLALIRLEHVDPDVVSQMSRRGLIPQPPPHMLEETSSVDAWLGRGEYKPPRCFLPYLDELKALLEDQAVPEAEIAREQRNRYMNRIPDTLYMVSSAPPPPAPAPAATCGGGGGLPPRTLARLRGRLRELLHTLPAQRAISLHAAVTQPHTQIALRAVREMSLPDECAELLLTEMAQASDRESPLPEPINKELAIEEELSADCCRSGSGRSRTRGGSLPRTHSHAPTHDNSRAGTCRRDASSKTLDSTLNRAAYGAPGGEAVGGPGGGRALSARVPDVAMAPNANTHLLTARDYAPQYSSGVLQLDLGDGATHTPRPGSRAARASNVTNRPRELTQVACVRSRADEEELRAAIELSVIRAYSTFGASAARRRALPTHQPHSAAVSIRSRATPSPSALSASNSGHLAAAARDHTPTQHLSLSRLSSSSSGAATGPAGGQAGGAGGSASPSPSHYYVYRRQDYRTEGGSYGSSASNSRGPSPGNYA